MGQKSGFVFLRFDFFVKFVLVKCRPMVIFLVSLSWGFHVE